MAELTLEILAAELAAHKADYSKLDGEFAQLKAENAALKGTKIAVNAAAVLPKIPAELVKYNGKQYKWNVPHFKIPGTVAKDGISDTLYYTSEEAATDETVIAKILAIKGQGLLKEVL